MINDDALPYVLPLFLAAAMAAAVAAFLVRGRDHSLRLPLAAILLLGAGWSFGYALEILFVELKWKAAWAAIQYPFILSIPVAWIVFTSRLAGFGNLVSKRNIIAMLVIPLAMQASIWSNKYHHLFWEGIVLRDYGSVVFLDFSYGPLFWLANVYGLSLILTSVFATLYLVLHDRSMRFSVRTILVVSPLAPLLANIVYVQRWGPLPNLDLTPITFALSGMLLGYCCLFRRLGNVSFETRLAASEQRIRSALNAARTGTIYWDVQSGTPELNDEAMHILDIGPDGIEPGNDAWLKNVHHDESEQLKEQYQSALIEQDAIELTFRIVRASGSVNHIEANLSCVRDFSGEPAQICGLIRDVSETARAQVTLRKAKKLEEEANQVLQQELVQRKKIEKQLIENETSLANLVSERTNELKDSKERIRLLLDSTMEGIIGLDSYGNCTFCNAAALKMLGCAADDIFNKNVHTLIHHTRRDRLTNLLDDCKICGVNYQSIAVHSDDQLFWRSDNTSFTVECWSHPMYSDGVLIGSVITFLDIEHRRRQQEQQAYLRDQLRHSQKMEAIGSFSSGIAHDFNNILNGLNGCLDLALDAADDNPELRSYLRDAMSGSKTAGDLIDQILSYSRKEAVAKSGVNLLELLQSTLQLLRRTVPATIEIKTNFKIEDAWINANATQIQQVLLNVFSNSVAAIGSEQGTIELVLEAFNGWSDLESAYSRSKSPRYLQISIRDSGHGIAQKDMEKIFEPFFTTKDPAVGTGMGLAIAYSIIQDHSGIIDVSSNPGGGTTVTIYLPKVKQTSPIVDLESAESNIRDSRGRILLVDDDPISLRVFTVALEKVGCEVVAMKDGESALDFYRDAKDEFDLVITDETMPRMTGATLTSEILKIRKDQAIILCTGYSMAIDEEHAMSIGVSRFLMKPVALQVLVEITQDVLFETQQKRR